MGRVLPVNMVYTNRPRVGETILLSEEVSLKERAYHYKLGAWELGRLPFGTETEKGVIKLPSVKSVQGLALEQTAAFLAGDIAAARINGTEVIETIRKTAEGNTVEVTYTVAAPGDITKVELLDKEGRVLTSAAVYVPVADPVQLRHLIPVKEGT